jgi:hypothetical protein
MSIENLMDIEVKVIFLDLAVLLSMTFKQIKSLDFEMIKWFDLSESHGKQKSISQNLKKFSKMSIENLMDIELKVIFWDLAVLLNMTFKQIKSLDFETIKWFDIFEGHGKQKSISQNRMIFSKMSIENLMDIAAKVNL